jgi:hypothetical protein
MNILLKITINMITVWLGCEADHSPQSSAKVKNAGAIPPLPNNTPWHGA